MKRRSITQQLVHASPHMVDNPSFTKKVMDKVMMTRIKPAEQAKPVAKRKSWLAAALYTKPVFAALAGAITVIAISGTVYAISFLWPQPHLTVTTPTTTTSGRKAVEVFGNDCPEVSNKKYELKKVAPFGPEKIADVVKAECNLEAIYAWAQDKYSIEKFSPSIKMTMPDLTPGKVREETQLDFEIFRAFKVKSIDSSQLVTEAIDEWNGEKTLAYAPETQFVINHQYGAWQDIKLGDAITYVSIIKRSVKNNADCNQQSCDGTTISENRALKAIIKLDQPYEDYNKFGSLSEIIPCQGNPNDYCHTGNTASFDIYMSNGSESNDVGTIEGVLQSYSADGFVLKTTSGRLVTVKTAGNLIQNFNDTRASAYNTTLKAGDTFEVTYGYSANAHNPELISQRNILSIMVLIEINSKADLKPDTPPIKY